jgi:hypothetical protein
VTALVELYRLAVTGAMFLVRVLLLGLMVLIQLLVGGADIRPASKEATADAPS